MKKVSYLLLLLISVWLGGCESTSDAPPYGYIETTEEGSTTLVLKGYEDYGQGFNVFEAKDFDSPFYLKDKKFVGSAYHFASGKEGRLADMTEKPAENAFQESIEVVEGRNYWVSYKGTTKYIYLKLRVAYISGNNVGIEYIIGDTKDRDLTENLNANLVSDGKTSVTFYEMPHLNATNVYVDHYVTVDSKQMLNYAFEWNAEKKHSAWVAFSFDEVTVKKEVERSNAWAVDPGLPESMQVTEAMHKNDGFDKGHLCASADRLYTLEANQQTFYYSNMTPMLNDLNTGFWARLEEKVRAWGSAIPSTYDKVYVVKGGTLNSLLLGFTGTPVYNPPQTPETDANGLTVRGLACPKYYFMAILSQKGDTYNAIGFWVEHKEGVVKSPTAADFQAFAISIDELEQKTGLDLFCNLPDVIEETIEKSYNKGSWTW